MALHDALETPLLDLGCYSREERHYTPHITMGQIMLAVMPYLYFGVAVMLLVFLWPPLATWLPGLMGN